MQKQKIQDETMFFSRNFLLFYQISILWGGGGSGQPHGGRKVRTFILQTSAHCACKLFH
jgi:hypothetical protein